MNFINQLRASFRRKSSGQREMILKIDTRYFVKRNFVARWFNRWWIYHISFFLITHITFGRLNSNTRTPTLFIRLLRCGQTHGVHDSAPAFCKCMRIFWQPPMQLDMYLYWLYAYTEREHARVRKRDRIKDKHAVSMLQPNRSALVVWVHGEFPC